eukprot:TRINITY_DN10432_c0_g1_i2.p1 TRINITY_DN10432_c0_g1~~TRINITY_DN10432_c0_g1_i2.p1  ORF type:complete len:475 (-),score=73.71 TRINITY_DN10432_c0_g1_i2:119-1543(-)
MPDAPRPSDLDSHRSSSIALSERDPELGDKDPDAPPMSTMEKHAVPIVFIVFVVMRAMDRVFAKRVSDRMKNYQLLYINVLWPIGIQVITVVMVIGYIVYKRRVEKDVRYDWRFLLPGSAMASGTGAIAMWRLGLFSIFDQLNAALTSLPAPFIDITSQNIMNNTVIIWTVLISMWYIGTRYSQVHFIGCVLIVLSGIVSVTVEVQTHQGLGEYKAANGQTMSSSALWYVIFLIGTVPAGISNCYKQKTLQKFDLEVMYATLWSGFFQIIWGILFFPINWIALPNLNTNYPSETGTYFEDGWTCFMGHSPVADDPDNVCASSGGSAAVWFMVYLMFNITFNVLFLWLTKRMSATWAAIATVLCQDLSSLFSMSSALMGSEATPVTFEQYIGLIVAAVAMWTYNLEKEVLPPVDGQEGSGSRRASSMLSNASFCSDHMPLVRSFGRGVPVASAWEVDGMKGASEGFLKQSRRTIN